MTIETPKFIWKYWYDYIAKYDLQTMNYGYLESKCVKGNRSADTDADKNSIQLYKKISNIKNLNLNAGDIIVEVGCGRGGGLFYLAKKYPLYKFIGIDLSCEAIKCANNIFTLPNLKFIVSDAASLPFDDGTISVILNIESSHCYPNFSKFMSETKRVLKHMGFFCYADFRNSFYEIQEYFEIMFVKDITRQVLNSLETSVPYRQSQVDECMKQANLIDKCILNLIANEFICSNSSILYKSLKTQTTIYTHIQGVNIKGNANKKATKSYPSYIFTPTDLLEINRKEISIPYFIDKINFVNNLHNRMSNRKPLQVYETSLTYNRCILKTVSNNFTKPVIFRGCGIDIDDYNIGDKVQVLKNEIISIVEYNSINDQQLYAHRIERNQMHKLNNLFGEDVIYYDLFYTKCGNVTGVHCEMCSSIILQMEGRKMWRLIDPKYSDLLIPFSTGEPFNVYNSLNYGWSDISGCKFPVYEVILEKGDILFVPSWWWHQPISLTNSKHIGVRTIHEDTYHHELLKPKIIYKYLKPMQGVMQWFTTTNDNTDLNNGNNIKKYYKKNGAIFLN